MKLKKVVLENFRSFRQRTIIDIEDKITAFIGVNDSGKSSVLEALDIFFNGMPVKDDVSVGGNSEEVKVSCIFSDLPNNVVIDSSNETALAQEYLLNSEHMLEICKVYNCSLAKPKIQASLAIALHPSDENYNDLLLLKNSELQKRARDLGIDLSNVNRTKNAEIRQALWNNITPTLVSREISLDNNDDVKKIWTAIAKYLPLYALFKSDRSSTDQDSEAQDPMMAAVKSAIEDSQNDFDVIVAEVKNKVEEVARLTVSKLADIDPSLASQLTPRVSVKKLDSLFGISLTGDDQIPINKRGSGVRRLILLSFFRADAERRLSGGLNSGIIYAVEEPETSQHPNNQKIILDALQDLAELPHSQVLLTTHTPVLGRLLPQSSLRYVKHGNVEPKINPVTQDNINEVIKTLGVLPDHNVRVFLGVEGKNDIAFFKNITSRLCQDDPTIPNLIQAEKDGFLVFIPLGGSSLSVWVDRLNGLNRPQFYLMDRDTEPPARPKYQTYYEQFRAEGHEAWITEKKELENYIHPTLITEPGYEGTGTPFENVPLLLAKATHINSESTEPWESLSEEKRKSKESSAKVRLNNHIASNMTLDLLNHLDPSQLLLGWLRQIGNRINNPD